jgi:repressor LexA
MPDFSTLTPRQREIYDYIRDLIENRGYPPTVREIGKHFEIESPNGVMCHLKALEKKGLIVRQEGKARAIQLVDYHPGPAAELPLLGNVAAGAPIQAVTNEERLSFGDLFCKPENFALRVRGESMIDDHIDDGDFVVVQEQNTARDGDIVVAVLEDNVATLKRFYKEKDRIRLQPANGAMSPIYARDVQIQGKVIGVIRKLS